MAFRSFPSLRLLAAVALMTALAGPLYAATQAHPGLPSLISSDVGPLHLLGQATLRFLGFEVYQASLWVADEHAPTTSTYALELRYARRFRSGDLVQASVREFERLGLGNADQRRRWQAEMAAIFPDVRDGDRIVGVYLPGRETRFYSDAGLLGVVADAEFGRAFFAIWLDPRTRDPSLRARLLGVR